MAVALRIWTGSKLCANERSLTGAELLGLTPVEDVTSHLYGHVPIPPVLDYQCDSVAIEWMKSLTTDLLEAMTSRIKKRQHSEWFEIFLTIFVLLNNLEYVYDKQTAFLQYLGPVSICVTTEQVCDY